SRLTARSAPCPYTLSLHDALPILAGPTITPFRPPCHVLVVTGWRRRSAGKCTPGRPAGGRTTLPGVGCLRSRFAGRDRHTGCAPVGRRHSRRVSRLSRVRCLLHPAAV